jgi:4-amino-4-deoxy-L-arabinose transferase-like glycosyltransferase
MRAVSDDAGGLGHRHSSLYLIVMLLLGLLPWTLLLPSVAVALWRDRGRIDRWDPRLVALLWMLAVLVPYVFAASKRGVYLLPLFPAVAFLLGWWGSRLLHGHVMAPWLARLLTPLAWLLASLLGILGLAAAAQALGLPLLDATVALLPTATAIDLRPIAAAATWPLAAALLIAAIAAATLASTAARGRWRIALPALVVSLVAVVVGARGTILPAIGAAQSRREFAQALRRAVVDPADVHTIGGLDYGTLFYWGAPIEVYDPANAGQQPPYLVLPELAWLRMPPTVRRHYRRVPGLTVEHGGDEGYVAVLQRSGEPHT